MNDLQGLRAQFVESKKRVQLFALDRKGQMTKRQKSSGEWVAVSWGILCSEAVAFYTQLIAECDAGTYVQQYQGIQEG